MTHTIAVQSEIERVFRDVYGLAVATPTPTKTPEQLIGADGVWVRLAPPLPLCTTLRRRRAKALVHFSPRRCAADGSEGDSSVWMTRSALILAHHLSNHFE